MINFRNGHRPKIIGTGKLAHDFVNPKYPTKTETSYEKNVGKGNRIIIKTIHKEVPNVIFKKNTEIDLYSFTRYAYKEGGFYLTFNKDDHYHIDKDLFVEVKLIDDEPQFTLEDDDTIFTLE